MRKEESGSRLLVVRLPLVKSKKKYSFIHCLSCFGGKKKEENIGWKNTYETERPCGHVSDFGTEEKGCNGKRGRSKN